MATDKKMSNRVKNKTPATVQITAEQLLREAQEGGLERVTPRPSQKISDPEELADFQMGKRKGFEDSIRKNRTKVGTWLKYAAWEESQQQLDRARSVFERALDVAPHNPTLYVKYGEMEMKNKQINHARNLWDRAVGILPQVKQTWQKYAYMEECLGNVGGTRQVYERWIQWNPDEESWYAYINFELRHGEVELARAIYKKFVIARPKADNWIKYARFADKNMNAEEARNIFQEAMEFFGDEFWEEKLFVAFGAFEEKQREHERVRIIYKYALDRFPKESTREVMKCLVRHEKKYGDRAGIEDVVVNKRKWRYQEQVKANPLHYDAWFDLLRLLESELDANEEPDVFKRCVEEICETYEQAISNKPPKNEKRYWRRYIYLWIKYAQFEELDCGDAQKARQVYATCLRLIPHKSFTFAKVWLLAAELELRQKDQTAARKILGMSLGICPKEKLFREYIEMDTQLRDFDHCRELYKKWVNFAPENCRTWHRWAEMETLLGETDRARALYIEAVREPQLDMPEMIWKAFIDFEIEQEEMGRARNVYEALLRKTQHLKVWVSYAAFERDHGEGVARARDTFVRAELALRGHESETRLALLEEWLRFETEHGGEKERVQRMFPKRVTKLRVVHREDGSHAGQEEYYDYVFPSDQNAVHHLNLIERAHMFKKQKLEQESLRQTGSHLE